MRWINIITHDLTILDESLLAAIPPFRRLTRSQVCETLDVARPKRFDAGHVKNSGMTGMTPFTLGRLLSVWEMDGIVASERRRITVTEPECLQASSVAVG